MPACASSSLNRPIAVRSSALGIKPASESVVALTSTMTRMWISLGRGDETVPGYDGMANPDFDRPIPRPGQIAIAQVRLSSAPRACAAWPASGTAAQFVLRPALAEL